MRHAPAPEPDAPEPPGREPSAAARRGRRVALALYYGAVLALIGSATVQVTRQLFYNPEPPSPYASCREGLDALVRGVDRARFAASGTDGEDAAIDRFRKALAPAWGYRDQIASSCKGSPSDEHALDAIERLRYAEEYAVRREAGDLAPLRRRVRTIVETDLGPGATDPQNTHGHAELERARSASPVAPAPPPPPQPSSREDSLP